jgi:hypothetical protein
MGDAYFDRFLRWCIAKRYPHWAPGEAISYYDADREKS